MIEDFGGAGAAHYDVLEPHSPAAGEVDAGLHAERHAGCERRGVAGHDVRVLVDLQADAVPRAVGEVLAVAGGRDDAASLGVDLLGGDAGPDGACGRRLRLAYQIVRVVSER
jgi:hypothetical protein